ncbi:ABC transporter permease [Oscillospiraceae bacterium PP1C4]
MNNQPVSKLKMFAKNNQIGMALLISLALFIITVILNPKSLNVNAFGSIFALTAMLAVAAAGQTLVIISDGIDMSVGATMSMTAILTVSIMQGKDSFGLFITALVVCVGVGAIVGLCNGMGAVKAGLPPMVVTLYISNIVTRLQYVFTGGTPKYTSVPDWYRATITTRLFRFLPTIVFFALAVYLVVYFLLNRTRYGQQLYLTGNNNRAAYLTGVKTTKVKVMNYTIAGAMAGFAGLIGAGNSGFIKCGTFESMTMESIVAVVIGGTLLSGGKGSYTGTAAGALLLIVLSNCLAVLQVTDSMKNLIMGVVLIILLTAYNRAKPVRQ